MNSALRLALDVTVHLMSELISRFAALRLWPGGSPFCRCTRCSPNFVLARAPRCPYGPRSKEHPGPVDRRGGSDAGVRSQRERTPGLSMSLPHWFGDAASFVCRLPADWRPLAPSVSGSVCGRCWRCASATRGRSSSRASRPSSGTALPMGASSRLSRIALCLNGIALAS